VELVKMQKLKNFTEKNLYGKLYTAINSLPEDFISDNLLTKEILKEKISRLIQCSTRQTTHKSDYKIKNEVVKSDINLYFGNTCDQYLICPICARKHTDVIKAKYYNKIVDLSKRYKYKYMVTFTIDAQKSFTEGFKIISESLRRFRRMGQRRGAGAYSGGEASKIGAAIGCGEAKRGVGSGLWHIHYHFIVMTNKKLRYRIYDKNKKDAIIKHWQEQYGRYPPQKELLPAVIQFMRLPNGNRIPISKLSKEWYLATEGKGINIKVIPINSKRSIEYDIHEIIKYASKVNDLTPEMLLELIVYKEKKHFLTTWGDLREKSGDILKPQNTVRDIEAALKVDYLEAIVYNKESGVYEKTNNVSEREHTIIEQLLRKKRQLNSYRIAANKARGHYKAIQREIKNEIFIKGLKNREYRLQIINEVNNLRMAYRVFIEKLFKYIIDIDQLRNKKLLPKRLSDKGKFYYNYFENLRIVPM